MLIVFQAWFEEEQTNNQQKMAPVIKFMTALIATPRALLAFYIW